MTKLVPALVLLAGLAAGCSSSSNAYGEGGGAGTGGTKTVVINELFAGGTSVGDPDWIELKNLTAATIDLGDYKLRDMKASDLSTLPAGFTIDPGGYFIVYCDDQK